MSESASELTPQPVDGAPASQPAETVAGFLAVFAIFAGLVGLAWHPLRLIGPAIVVSMIAAGMAGGRNRGLAFAAVLIVAACFFFGLIISVLTERPLW